MRTTLDLDSEVLQIARSIAAERKQSLGKVISEVFLKNLRGAPVGAKRNGIRVIERGAPAQPVALDTVNALRDEV